MRAIVTYFLRRNIR